MSQSATEKAKFRGAWDGSGVTDGRIEVLRHRRMLPPVERVEVCLPDAEGSPTPRDGEMVVFKDHFFHGFRLPASEFFSRFLVFFVLQPHHLAPMHSSSSQPMSPCASGFWGLNPV
ncbi:hypothetical protein D1007_15232 [Hordeum vulgare]|nr:hypothetical protein D1007_15232 [Hordeum vulgare]